MSLDQILNLGDDQIQSQFSVEFSSIPGGGDPVTISLRMDQEFDPPARETGTYEIWYQGQKIVKTSVVDATEKMFTLNFRIDQEWKTYSALSKWYSMVYDEEEGTAQEDAVTRTSFICTAYGPNKTPKFRMKYKKVKIKKLKVGTFNNQEGEPLRAEAEFIYLNYEEEKV